MNAPADAPRVRTVTDGVLHHVSASQVGTYELCPRKWWFQKVAQAPDHSSTASRDLGTAVHAELEDYLKGGPSPTMDIAQSGLVHLPPPGPDLLVEAALVPPVIVAGVPWEGKIDVVVPPTPDAPTEAWVIDHKTTKDFRYCKTSDELSKNIQMVSYAYWVGLRYWGPGALSRAGYRVKVSHVYYHTRPETLGPRAVRSKRVDSWVNMVDIPAQWAILTRTVEAMKADAAKSVQDEVGVDRDACGAFGGCPFRTRCNAAMNQPKNLSSMFKRPATLPTKSLPVVPSAPGPDAPPPEEAAAPDAPADGRLVLYVGCIPLVGPHAGIARPLETVVAPVCDAIAAESGVKDVRQIQFAMGKGELAHRLRANPPTGVFYVYRSHELAAVALEALTPLADVIVQGVQ